MLMPIARLRPIISSLREKTPQRSRSAAAGMISMGLRALSLLAKFGFMVILAKFTDSATVGIYALLVTVVTIAIYLIGLELHTFTAREIVADPGEARGHGSVHIQSHLLTLTGVFLLAVPVIWGIIFWLGLIGKFSFFILTVIVLLEVFGQELGRYLLVLSRPVASNFLQFVRGAAWMPVPIIFLVSDHGASATNIILLSWAGGAALADLFGFWCIRSYLSPLRQYQLSWLNQAFLSARHYFAVALLTQVQYYSDRFIVQRVMGEASVGVLSFYQSFANTTATFVQTGVISVMLPRLLLAAKRDDRAAESHVRRAIFLWAMALAIGISVALAVGMPLLLRSLNKPAYGSALLAFYTLLFGNIILIAGLVVHLCLYARRQDAQLMRVSLVVIPVSLTANAFAIPAFGVMGAACVFVFTSSLDLLVKYSLLRRVDAKKAIEVNL